MNNKTLLTLLLVSSFLFLTVEMEETHATTETNPISITNTSSTTDYRGMNITVNQNIIIYNITKPAGTTGTNALLVNSSWRILANITFTGNTATLSTPMSLSKGQNYYLLVGSAGNSYTYNLGTTNAFPVTGTSVNWTSGIVSFTTNGSAGTTITTNAYTIASFDYLNQSNPTTFFNITANDPLLGINLTTFNATVNGTFYNTTNGTILTTIPNSPPYVVNISVAAFNRLNTTYTNWNVTNNLNANVSGYYTNLTTPVFYPNPVYSTNNLTASVNYSDPHNHTGIVRFYWFRNGSSVKNDTWYADPLADQSGNNNTLTNNGATYNQANESYYFNGSYYLTSTNAVNFSSGHLSVTLKADNAKDTNAGRFIAAEQNSGFFFWQESALDNRYVINFRNSTGFDQRINVDVTDITQIHTLDVYWNSTTFSIYLDNLSISNTTINNNWTPSVSGYTIGGRTGRGFIGTIYEVKTYSTTSLVAWYPFSNNTLTSSLNNSFYNKGDNISVSVNSSDIYLANSSTVSNSIIIQGTPVPTPTNLTSPSQTKTSIYVTWTNTSDPRLNYTQVWIGSTNVANVTGNTYNFTGLSVFTNYTITLFSVSNDSTRNETNISIVQATKYNSNVSIARIFPSTQTYTLVENTTYIFNATVTDDDNSFNVTWYKDGVLNTTGVVSNNTVTSWNWTVHFWEQGAHTITLNATDPYVYNSSLTWSVTVNDTGISITPVFPPTQTYNLSENETYDFNVTASGGDGGNLTVSWYKNAVLQFTEFITNGFNSVWEWVVGYTDQGTYNITATVNDSAGTTASYTYNITVDDTYPAPLPPTGIVPSGGQYEYNIPLDCNINFQPIKPYYFEWIYNVNGSAYYNMSINNTNGYIVFDIASDAYATNYTFGCRVVSVTGTGNYTYSQQFRKVNRNNFYLFEPRETTVYQSMIPYTLGYVMEAENTINASIALGFVDCNGNGLWDYTFDYRNQNKTSARETFSCINNKGTKTMTIGMVFYKNNTQSWNSLNCKDTSTDTLYCAVYKSYQVEIQ